ISWTDQSSPGQRPPARTRLVDLDPYGTQQGVPVLTRAELAERAESRTGQDWLAGPCVIEEPAATTLVLPGQIASQDKAGNLILEESEARP
ncbi:MAG: hypothetical protein ACTHJW_13610, partial [Streptosporangiaceae bacterium]